MLSDPHKKRGYFWVNFPDARTGEKCHIPISISKLTADNYNVEWALVEV